MFSRIIVGTNSIDQPKVFYDVLLGSKPGVLGHKRQLISMHGDDILLLILPIDG